ncbi:helix-turn-helix transcriptional regulator [Myceligenerans salitolerans]|uniref:Helix-turn-helix transcriptional regulator n=1 Tax=Myceligenerans salitolerans TaxID=1230528 RepID=A0ABS3I9C5_9MICO|nr:helix-turn-helix transcriptional regulator [Myceligenerans salitolerans]
MPRTALSPRIREGRTALGARLRDLRRAAGMTGQQLAESLSWARSKVSKIENAHQPPTDEDVRSWCAATNSTDQVESLLAELHTLQTRHQEWERVLRGGMASTQNAVARREEETRLFRGYESGIVPGLLQTPAYATAILERVSRTWGRTDLEAAVVARMRRQDVLRDPSKQFRFVITEAVLLYNLCSPGDMLGQVDRLREATALPNVRFGIIPFDQPLVVTPKHPFGIYDDRRVVVETVSALLQLTQAAEVEAYAAAFDALESAAVHGKRARAVLRHAARQIAARQIDEKH